MKKDPDTGDIHGQLDDIERLLKKIAELKNSTGSPAPHVDFQDMGFWQWSIKKPAITIDSYLRQIFNLPRTQESVSFKSWSQILPAEAAEQLTTSLSQCQNEKNQACHKRFF